MTYLYNHTDEDKSLVFFFLIDTSPPDFESKTPVPWATYATSSLGQEGPVELIRHHQSSLLATDKKQLLILGLKQANANGKINIHDPELHLTRKCAVQSVHYHDDDQVDVQDQKGQN